VERGVVVPRHYVLSGPGWRDLRYWGVCGGRVCRSENHMWTYVTAEPRPSAFRHGPVRRPFYVCVGSITIGSPSSSLAHGAPSRLHSVCDVSLWTISGVPRDLSG
jgi:hypothetical protein